ncbi:MAG: lipid-A-disaccharide synthase [Candidatus Omnitrophota bacterium]
MDKNILIIAGEVSGDARAGELLSELKTLIPGVHFWGIGGDRMTDQNAELVEHIRNFSIVGVSEAIQKLPKIRKQYKDIIGHILKRKPCLAILVDYPGFNLRLAGFLHRRGIPVVYYIIPQVWAWGAGRIKKLRRFTDKTLVLFDFEKDLLSHSGVDCEFVGHPLLDNVPDSAEDAPHSADRNGFTIALLPGSRKSEITNMLPVMLSAARKICARREKVRFVLAENSNIEKDLYDSILADFGDLDVSRLTDDTFTCLAQCDFAIVTSGTATLEAAIFEKPMVIVYRAAYLTYILFRLFAKVSSIGLVNIIAGKEIVPELIQNAFTPEKLSGKVLELTEDAARIRAMKDALHKVKLSLGEKGASRRAAEAIKRFMQERGI